MYNEIIYGTPGLKGDYINIPVDPSQRLLELRRLVIGISFILRIPTQD